MASFRVIAERDAPKPRKVGGRLNQRMAEYEGYVGAVGSGKVGQISPSDGDTVRGIALRVSRAAKRMGKEIETWVADGNVYFRAR